eukprot:scaffold104797_cov48-Phaeocystis_antarctica.AAC.3
MSLIFLKNRLGQTRIPVFRLKHTAAAASDPAVGCSGKVGSSLESALPFGGMTAPRASSAPPSTPARRSSALCCAALKRG